MWYKIRGQVTGEHPIHDRWWLSEKNGLRIGTSANSLGGGKLSEISVMSEAETTSKLEEVDRYLVGKFSDFGADRMKYMSFRL
jgi:hypothetical protein